jgi:hypothetical protein
MTRAEPLDALPGPSSSAAGSAQLPPTETAVVLAASHMATEAEQPSFPQHDMPARQAPAQSVKPTASNTRAPPTAVGAAGLARAQAGAAGPDPPSTPTAPLSALPPLERVTGWHVGLTAGAAGLQRLTLGAVLPGCLPSGPCWLVATSPGLRAGVVPLVVLPAPTAAPLEGGAPAAAARPPGTAAAAAAPGAGGGPGLVPAAAGGKPRGA